MGSWVKTVEAKQALRQIVREEIGPAGDNNIISEKETRFANQWLRGVARSLPRPGLSTDLLLDQAVDRAMVVWEKYNPMGHGVDSKYLAQREIRHVSGDNRALGTLTIRAYERVARPSQTPRPMLKAAKKSFEKKPLDQALGTNWDAVDLATRKPLLREAVEFYRAHFDDDQVTQMTVAVPFRNTFFWVEAVIGTGKDGTGAVELFDDDGRAMASAALQDGRVLAWDATFGDVRETV